MVLIIYNIITKGYSSVQFTNYYNNMSTYLYLISDKILCLFITVVDMIKEKQTCLPMRLFFFIIESIVFFKVYITDTNLKGC